MGEAPTAYIPYSALEYNDADAISGISGSAIAGGVDSAVVSSIVSSYVESSVSGKADQSALDNCCSSMSSVVSAKADSSALSSYIPYSAVSGEDSKITAINGSAIGGGGGGDTAGLVPFSSFGYQDTAISSISSSAVYDPSAHARIDELSSNAVSYTSFEYNTSNNITAVNGSAIGVNLNETPLVIDGNTMSAAASSDGIHIGMIGAQVKIVSNSSQATAANIVYVVTG